jgi:ADP-ribose pyrophosphatase
MKNHSIRFQGKIISVETAEVALPNGTSMQIEAVHHPGGAAVVAVDENNQICLLKQYRPVFDAWLWELPAGKIDDHEPPLETARRELTEEAGIVARDWQSLGYMLSSPGVYSEKVYLYAARELQQVDSAVEEHEIFEIHWLDVETVISMIASNEITDAKSVIAILKFVKL